MDQTRDERRRTKSRFVFRPSSFVLRLFPFSRARRVSATPGEPAGSAGRPVGSWHLFVLFLRAGLVFGGGITIMAVLQEELVRRRRAVSRTEFLTLYGLARIVPSGTITALAVGFGYLFGGFPGTVVALAGVALPARVPTIALTVLYASARGSPWFDVVVATLLPAAVALLAGAVLSIGREVA